MGRVGHKFRGSPLSMKDLPREVLYEIVLSSTEGVFLRSHLAKKADTTPSTKGNPAFTYVKGRGSVWPGWTKAITVLSLRN